MEPRLWDGTHATSRSETRMSCELCLTSRRFPRYTVLFWELVVQVLCRTTTLLIPPPPVAKPPTEKQGSIHGKQNPNKEASLVIVEKAAKTIAQEYQDFEFGTTLNSIIDKRLAQARGQERAQGEEIKR